jgi:dihydropteroate synthase
MIPSAGLPQVIALRDVSEARALMSRMGVSTGGTDIMDKKALFRVVRVKGLDFRAANILKQEMLSRGGEVATSRDVYEFGGVEADCLVLGTLTQFERVLPKLRAQPFGLRDLATAIAAALQHYDAGTPAFHQGFDLSRGPRVMGILNVTPDSFSDPGDHFDADVAVAAAWRMVEEGADMIDVGGESTRPGSDRTEPEEEMRRVLPVIRALAGSLPVPISVDTYRASVASAALEAGAFMVNDVSAFRMDPALADVVRDAGCPVALMHMLGEPKTMQDDPVYDDVVDDVFGFFVERLTWAVDQGIPEEHLMIDPGIGFGKTLTHNLQLLRRIGTFRSLGRPILLGTSRKRFIGEVLGLPEPKERTVGTAATSVIAAVQDVDMVRVHDVRENVEAIRMTRAIFPARDE